MFLEFLEKIVNTTQITMILSAVLLHPAKHDDDSIVLETRL